MADEEENDHLSQTGVYNGVLSRNSSYKKDARGRLVGQGLYGAGKHPVVLAAIKKQDAAMGRPDGRLKGSGKLINDLTQSQRAHTYRITFKQNFKEGFTNEPYPHQAHHVLPVEVFYHKKWTTAHLDVVYKIKYDINNNKNIIYLPQGESGDTHVCEYHMLPNHAKGHSKYNNRVILEADEVWSLVDKIVQAGKEKCPIPKADKDKILNTLKAIESDNYELLKGLGPLPMT